MLDFNHKSPNGRINALVDAALIGEQAEKPRRDYLGGSRLGHWCERALQYEYFHTPPDSGREFSGQTLRIFELGHTYEDKVIRWLRLAGFDLRTEGRDGRQFGFSVAKGRIRGHCDGVLVGGPDVIQYPALWECKSLKAKSWRDTVKHKVKKSKPVYYGQVQIYMAYFGLTDNPAIFTAVNKDTEEIYFEAVPFDAAEAQRLSDRGVNILQSCDAGILLPRATNDPAHFECKWCNYYDRCWR